MLSVVTFVCVCMQGLVDTHIFEEAQPILKSLQRQDCGPALVWCAANRAKLRKAKSKLEFRLRVQVGTRLHTGPSTL